MRAIPGGLAAARAVLNDRFGYPAFRPAQLKVLAPLLSGRDVLAVLPTGAGKSLCYQVPGLLSHGTTLVVSPLISLMQDQVAGLRARGVAAAYLSSTQTRDEAEAVRAALRSRTLSLLYCAPERLKQVIPLFAGSPCPLLAVDEAHCVVEWGTQFRPHYRALGVYRARLGYPLTIALTGSATPRARDEILRVFRLRQAHVVTTTFDRPNLRFAVREVPGDRERFALIADLVRRADGGGHTLVYTPTRRLSELVARALLLRSVRAAPYHAGLSAGTRRRVLERFLENRSQVIVATSAFGMGIDKPDVRRVIHWGPSRTMESYYQEAGRGGRDGGPAECLLLWRSGDLAWDTVSPEMRAYLVGRACRRRMLLEHFGEEAVACTGCDRCHV